MLYAYDEELTEAEIAAQLDRQVMPLGFKGPVVKTISRWLALFRRDATNYTPFFIRQFKENNLECPPILPPDRQAKIPDYTARYFLECLTGLYWKVHRQSRNKLQFLWHANQLLYRHFNRTLFKIRPP